MNCLHKAEDRNGCHHNHNKGHNTCSTSTTVQDGEVKVVTPLGAVKAESESLEATEFKFEIESKEQILSQLSFLEDYKIKKSEEEHDEPGDVYIDRDIDGEAAFFSKDNDDDKTCGVILSLSPENENESCVSSSFPPETETNTNSISIDKNQWSADEKRRLYYWFCFSRHDCWGRGKKNLIFEQKIEMEPNIPNSKIKMSSTKNLTSLMSHMNPIVDRELNDIKAEALKRAGEEYNYNHSMSKMDPTAKMEPISNFPNYKYTCTATSGEESFPSTNQLVNKLMSHISPTHDKVKPFHCTVCDKAFDKSDHLKRHTLIHTGKLPYRMDCLTSHCKSHSGERPYKCTVCDKTFVRLDHLKRHHCMSHSDVKPYNCTVCNKAFATMDCLKSHSMTHSDEKPYKCTVCEKAFTRMGCLKRHCSIHSDNKNADTRTTMEPISKISKCDTTMEPINKISKCDNSFPS